MKALFIAEKPSVAQQFAEALDVDVRACRRDGYLESERCVITWCVGHLVTMSYPEKYDERFRRWSFNTLPFLPATFRYEVIPEVEKQFRIVAGLLHREDISTIYVCTDSGREGEYIYRLVEQEAGIGDTKERRRVWIDSQTREEIRRGVREAKPESAYDSLADAAFSRAKEDYLMGINFSRALTLRYGREISRRLGREKSTVVAAGRVMTCVLGMIVRREQEIRDFRKTVFYKLNGSFSLPREGEASESASERGGIDAEFRGREGSPHYRSTELYKNSGFLQKKRAEAFRDSFLPLPKEAVVDSLEKKKEMKNPPLLYNLAELQNDCSRLFKINPDETLQIAQELYEKKLTTYPRTDARVLSTAVAKEIERHLRGLLGFPDCTALTQEALDSGAWRKIEKTRYTDDRKITDHYAIIPTGQGLDSLRAMKPLSRSVYTLIVRRFLSIFFPAAEYQRLQLSLLCEGEFFQMTGRALRKEGYLRVLKGEDGESGEEDGVLSEQLLRLKRGERLLLRALRIKEGETSPPRRYTSGTMILAMENAGSLIEDEELRAQIKGSGIGTSATRAGILTKLTKIGYIALNKKTQALSPTSLGELVTAAVSVSVRQLLNPELTASWEKGLSYVADGSITEKEYMQKLECFVRTRTEAIKSREACFPKTGVGE